MLKKVNLFNILSVPYAKSGKGFQMKIENVVLSVVTRVSKAGNNYNVIVATIDGKKIDLGFLSDKIELELYKLGYEIK